MDKPQIARPEVVSAEEWQRAREELLVEEKRVTRLLDATAAKRRRLPMVRFDKPYVFDSPTGPRTLVDLFDGRTQLAAYQFMDNGPDEFCPGCTWLTDNVPPEINKLLASVDASWVTISNMPLAQIEGYKAQRGWTIPFVSSHGMSFSDDCGAGGGFMLNVFMRDGDEVYRTYNTTARGVDHMLLANNVQDLLPWGRQEEWEDSPPGWPQHPTYG